MVMTVRDSHIHAYTMNVEVQTVLETVSTRYQLLKHYKLKHYHFGQRHSFPCTYYECRCSFKTWNALKTLLSRCHVDALRTRSVEQGVFICLLCPGSEIPSSREYFSHINNHLKCYETVTCVFQNSFSNDCMSYLKLTQE